jgi:hypothetical protein
MTTIVNHPGDRNMHPQSTTTSQHTQTALAPFATICASLRVQPYRFIHKALRVLLLQTLQVAGSMDVSNPAERQQLVDEVDRTLSVCEDHLAHENGFFHAPLQARSARAVMAFEADHHDHLAHIEVLRLLLLRVRDASDAEAPALAYELYLRLSQFVGENLAHMAEEETTLTQALWEQFTDEQIMGFTEALHATLSPEEMGFYLQWMVRSLNIFELSLVLQPLPGTMPPEAYSGLMEMVRAELSPARWQQLARRLGLQD